jgi:hypothetical protein
MEQCAPDRKEELRTKMRVILGDDRYAEAMGVPLETLKPVNDEADGEKEPVCLDGNEVRPLQNGEKKKKRRTTGGTERK